MTFGALSFASPLLLAGLLALPIIWWLLRLTPPRPREEVFPPTRILEEIGKKEETPAKSPWWLTLLRLLMAAFVIFALAEPVWNAPDQPLRREGSLLILFDDGWTTGQDWEERKGTAERLLTNAEQNGQPVAMIYASDGAKADVTAQRAESWNSRLSAAVPTPASVDLNEIASKISDTAGQFTSIAILSGAVVTAGAPELKTALEASGADEIAVYLPTNAPLALVGVENTPDALSVNVERPAWTGMGPRIGTATAYDEKGRSLASVAFTLNAGEPSTVAQFKLPVELRNEIARVGIDESKTAAIQLLDERFRRRRVGLLGGGNADSQQPLLSPLYYISRALKPFAEVREPDGGDNLEAIKRLINERISTMVLADIGVLPGEATRELSDWVERGGMLIRFAGPRLAAGDDGQLVPVELRRGGRSLGGTLTWGEAQRLTSFGESSPFNDIPVPEDVTVTRQVLAQPDIDLEARTWASLEDGTPLVTASQRGKGWIVLFHVTADTGWSNLPLSGTFVDMLRRLVAVSNNSVAADQARSSSAGVVENGVEPAETLPPLQVVDGFGVLTNPSSEVRPLATSGPDAFVVSRKTPPGLYGSQEAFVASNLFNEIQGLERAGAEDFPAASRMLSYMEKAPTLIKPWLLALALILLALDCIAVLWMAGALRFLTPAAKLASLILAAWLIIPTHPSIAQTSGATGTSDFKYSLRTRLAYVKTGDTRVDTISRKGLQGLTRFIAERTSLEPGDPVGVDIATDELAFFPLLYWPISIDQPVPSEAVMARIDAFMKKGGSVLFDTRDQLSGGFGGTRTSGEVLKLRAILSTLDVPPLEPVPENHVLTRAFYLLGIFPGRYLDGKLWVEASQLDEESASQRPARPGDGVSSIMITSNDMAAAWAVEADGSPSLPVVPPNPRQRVYAYRTGVNIIMYTLTGNYKSDQVHVPALLERLGQ